MATVSKTETQVEMVDETQTSAESVLSVLSHGVDVTKGNKDTGEYPEAYPIGAGGSDPIHADIATMNVAAVELAREIYTEIFATVGDKVTPIYTVRGAGWPTPSVEVTARKRTRDGINAMLPVRFDRDSGSIEDHQIVTEANDVEHLARGLRRGQFIINAHGINDWQDSYTQEDLRMIRDLDDEGYMTSDNPIVTAHRTRLLSSTLFGVIEVLTNHNSAMADGRGRWSYRTATGRMADYGFNLGNGEVDKSYDRTEAMTDREWTQHVIRRGDVQTVRISKLLDQSKALAALGSRLIKYVDMAKAPSGGGDALASETWVVWSVQDEGAKVQPIVKIKVTEGDRDLHLQIKDLRSYLKAGDANEDGTYKVIGHRDQILGTADQYRAASAAAKALAKANAKA